MRFCSLVIAASGVLVLAAPTLCTDAAAVTVPQGKVGVFKPEATAEGSWDGAWIYVCRDWRMALWIRTDGGVPRMKIRYESTAAPESFETDWETRATYFMAGTQASFAVTWKNRDASSMRGEWKWDVQFERSGRSESGEFEVVRVGNGRNLSVVFDKFERQVRRSDGKVLVYPSTPVWTFRKVSRRADALWEELPF